MKNNLLIGSHVSYKAKEYFVGSVEESLSYNSNCMMIYTGAPQNTIRKEIDLENVNKAHKILINNNIKIENVIVHAPYIINLASSKIATRELAKSFLVKELKRVAQLGLKYIVLHPGCHLEQDRIIGIQLIIEGLNYAFEEAKNNVWILLETMSGKGTEIGINFDEIQKIMVGVNKKQIGVCMDTCHMHESGMDISNVDLILDDFDKKIGLFFLKAIHLNDSKNEIGAKKDRHENIGYGKIGYDILYKWYLNDRISNVPKILETPYYERDGKFFPPYKEEIKILKENKWFDFKI